MTIGGFFLLVVHAGSNCWSARSTASGAAGCQARTGSGVPLQLAADIAQQHGWKPAMKSGFLVCRPAQRIGVDVPEFDRVSRINGMGACCLRCPRDAAASMLSPAFRPRPSSRPAGGVSCHRGRRPCHRGTLSPRVHRGRISRLSWRTPPRFQPDRTFLRSAHRLPDLAEHGPACRRGPAHRQRATIGVGARPVRLLAGMLVKAPWGCSADCWVPGGFLVGTYLVDRPEVDAGWFWSAIAVHFTVGLIPIGQPSEPFQACSP